MAYLQKHSKNKQALVLVYKDVNDKRRKKYLGVIPKRQANLLLEQACSEERSRKLGLRVESPLFQSATRGPLFKEYASEYLREYRHDFPKTYGKVKASMVHLVDGFGDLRLDAGEQKWADAWKKYKVRRLAEIMPSTLQGEWMTLRKSLKSAVPSKIPNSPLGNLEFGMKVQQNKIHCFRKPELIALYEASNPVFAATWQFVANTGLRRGEIVMQRKAYVGREEVQILNDPEDNLETKTGKSRIVPLSDAAQDARERVLFYNPDGADFFPQFRDKSDWSKKFAEVRRLAEVDRGTLHGLRHTFISYLVNDLREPLPVVQELAGHAKVETTMRYIHVLPDHHKRAVQNLNL